MNSMDEQKRLQLERRRYSQRPFPPYRHRLGVTPHPSRDPEGHLFGKRETAPEPFSPDRWWEIEDYLYGVDLYNFRYYWEAHEAWEGLWKTTKKADLSWTFLRGLIQIAAALLKREQRRWRGVESLSHSGRSRLKHVCEVKTEYCGVNLSEFLRKLDIFFAHVRDDLPPVSVWIHLKLPDL